MKQITEIRCSGLYRPMACPGYLNFDLPKSPTNSAAEEGTAAGELLALKLLQRPVGVQASNGIRFDEDMFFYTQPVVEEIMTTELQSPVTCENRVDWQTRSGIWIRGSYDISYMKKNWLYIDDLKYGWGIVEPKENWQLLAYAIGRFIQMGMPQIEGVVLRIHQPRPHHEEGTTREWRLTTAQLYQYKEMIELRMLEIAQGQRPLVTGSQCKYCPAAGAACPAFNRASFSTLDVVFSDSKQDDISESEIALQMDIFARGAEILKIKMDSLKELAISRIRNAKLIPGYDTEKSYGDRKWKGNISPEVIKTLTGVDIVERSMLSPAKAEKAGVPKDLVKTFVDRAYLGEKLIKKDSGKDADKIFGKEAPRVHA